MSREKHNLIYELQKKNAELVGTKKLSLIGQGDFQGGNNTNRSTMNIKHHSQHLTIDNPTFPMFYDGKENVTGKYSTFHTETTKQYVVIDIIKKYEELLKGKCYIALYFLYCKDDDSYTVVERKESENLTECFGFDYNNEYLDNMEVGDVVPSGTTLRASTSYDQYGNVSIGVNGRILYAFHPAVQDDAIIISESFAKQMVANDMRVITVMLGDNTLLLNLYGKNGEYQGLPNVGDIITEENGIICATRTVKDTRMFSDLRDSSLTSNNKQGDQTFYGKGEIIDINVYNNNPDLKVNKATKQIVQYYNDAKWFYTKVYRRCKEIIKSGSKNIDEEINRWMRLAMNYLDTQALWAANDNTFHNVMIEILIRNKEPIIMGRKITGRHGTNYNRPCKTKLIVG